MNNVLINFLKENLNRIFTKKPRFFAIWQWITGLLMAVTGLPGLLASMNINLPAALTTWENKIVAVCAAGFFLSSQLTSASPVVAVTKDGTVLKATDENKLPFTSSVEILKSQQNLVPNSDVTLAEVKEVTK